jgi:HSP20 family protein
MFAIQRVPRSGWMKEFDSFFNAPFFNDSISTPRAGSLVPRVNISEDKDNFYVHAELPGLSHEDVKVTFSEGVLTIRGEKKKEEKSEDRNYHRIERRYGEFVRQFNLPENVKHDAIKADFRNGVLEITVPKTEPQKPKEHEIPINVGLN